MRAALTVPMRAGLPPSRLERRWAGYVETAMWLASTTLLAALLSWAASA